MSGHTQAVVPMLAYKDGPAAMDWLVRAFGFAEKTRWLAEDGKLSHGELLAGDALIMLASAPAHYESPRTLQARYEPARRWLPWVLNGVLVHVPDLEVHFERATRARSSSCPSRMGLPAGATARRTS